MKCTHCSLCYRVQAPLFVVQPKRTFHCHTDRAHLSLSYRLSTPFTVIPTERAFHCHTDRAQRVECISPLLSFWSAAIESISATSTERAPLCHTDRAQRAECIYSLSLFVILEQAKAQR